MTRDDLKAIRKILTGPLERRIANLLALAEVILVSVESGVREFQVKGFFGARDGIEHLESYGFTSRPFPGAKGLFARLTAGKGFAFLVGDRRYQFQVDADGEVAIYDDLGTRVHLKRGGILELKSTAKVRIDSPLLEVTGKITAAGNVEAGAEVKDQVGTMAAMRTTYNGHTHVENTAPTYTQNAVTQVPAAQM